VNRGLTSSLRFLLPFVPSQNTVIISLSTLGASPLHPSKGLSRCALSVPFLLPFSVQSISLCAAYEPAVANQSLKKIAILRGAIFAQICDLVERNFSQSSQILQCARNLREDIYVFPLKFTFSVLLAQNSPNTQHHRLNVYANITNYTKNSAVLRLPYCIS